MTYSIKCDERDRLRARVRERGMLVVALTVRRGFALLSLVLLALCLSGCLQAASPAAASRHAKQLERWYPDSGAQALAVASEKGDAAEVRRLMKEQGVNPDKHFAPDGSPLLSWSIYTKSPAGLKVMLENGADPNAAKPYPLPPDRTPRNYDNAMVYAVRQEDTIYLRLLLDHGGDPNTRSVNNESLLFKAMDQWQNVQLLVERGANVNDPTANVMGPIIQHYAIRGSFRAVYWLLQHGADPRIEYRGGLANPPVLKKDDSRTLQAIYWAPTEANSDASEWQNKCIRWLLAQGYKRPETMSASLKEERAHFGYPTDEKDIPLPDLKDTTP